MSDIRFNRWLHQSGTGGVSQDSSGNIGIGTTVPTMALDVRGNVNFSDTVNATTLSAVDGTFTGNVTIGGTLTYEDVANIDAVGIITAQSDIIVGGGLTVTGISTFNNDVKLLDDDKLKFGIGEDLQIYHDGGHSRIVDTGTGYIKLQSDQVAILNTVDNSAMAQFYDTGAAELYFSGSKKFETANTGAVVTGILTATTFSGNLTGNVTGDLTGNLAGISSIAAISSSISDTAVDVFVYDTRKDSDGGAWRKRTQHTSWYNETLNTSTRGSRREFPAVAVIVCLSSYIKIYDGDDPDLPLWMEIRGTTDRRDQGWLNSASVKAASALNGIIALATYGNGTDSGGTHIVDFIKDDLRRHSSAGGRSGDGLIITQRGTSVNLNVSTPLGLVVSELQNDVAMTVLPNAPIDDATGLPVPTIVVATDGGASVIKDDGNVYDDTDTTALGKVDFNDDYRVISTRKNTGSSAARFFISKRIDTVSSDSAWLYDYYTGNFASGYPRLRSEDTGAGITLGLKGDTSVRGSNIGFTLWDVNSSQIGPNDYSTNSLLCGIATSYNTGWMQGDIKGAFLSDTDATNVTGSEMVTNGGFDSDVSGWSVYNSQFGTFTQSSGQATLSDTSDGLSPVAYQSISGFVVGKTYVLKYDTVAAREAYAFMSQSAGQNNQNMSIQGYTGSRTGTQSITFVANATTMIVNFNDGSGSDYDITIDNVSIRLADPDRSVNNKGLQVFGTITKSAVATGAELVGYSFGNSNANYLKQPANLDFQFGTGDFSVMTWINMPDYSQTGFIFDRSDSSGNERFAWYMESDNLKFYTFDGANHSEIGLNTVEIGSAYDGKWVHCVATRHSSGLMEEYINGVLIHSQISTVRQINNEDAHMVVGGRYNNISGNEFDGSIALLRISGSIPSPEQIKKIYEDEKILFQENAACTLYGSSDAVTALAYDEDTELLHVGTSAGRSDFQGLRRINNTTTAVTTAISASDDLIAEQ